MSLLAPLYALGLLAIAAPILFHLIRRTPRDRQAFSSLMFLEPAPPRLTRKSRIDNWLLLLLRIAAIGLIAWAFARPYIRETLLGDLDRAEQRRVAVLVDQSASLRRGDAWARSLRALDDTLAEAGPDDPVAVWTFDDTVHPVLTFDESRKLTKNQIRATVKDRLASRSPTWGGTRLDRALIAAVEAIQTAGDGDEPSGRMPRRVVLISDLQQGSALEQLNGFVWPEDVDLAVTTIPATGSNASLHPLAAASPGELGLAEEGEVEPALRVRVSNAPDATVERFRLAWGSGRRSGDEARSTAANEVAVYVPPGEDRIIRVPRPEESDGTDGTPPALRLLGDSFDFDNRMYAEVVTESEVKVLVAGDDASGDPEGLTYYLDRALAAIEDRSVASVIVEQGEAIRPDDPRPMPLVVLTRAPAADDFNRLRAYLGQGGTVLIVFARPDTELARGLGRLAGLDGPLGIEDAAPSGYALWEEIAFDHPLFRDLSGPQFNDFTTIHFWNYRRLEEDLLGDGDVLARFDSGDPGVVEWSVGPGHLIAMTSGWQPSDSQIALSTKFVPILAALVERDRGPRSDPGAIHYVGDRVPLPAGLAATSLELRRPDGNSVRIDPAATDHVVPDMLGTYTLAAIDRAGDAAPSTLDPFRFAVNLDPAESLTAALDTSALERLGCKLADEGPGETDPEARRERARQLLAIELEGRQQLWRYIVLGAIGILLVETWLAGWVTRRRSAPAPGADATA